MDEYIRKQDAVMQLSHNKSRGDDEWELAVASDMEIIRKLPPADVAPVVHAYWRDTGSGQECSACKEIQYGYDTGRYFCANCGAKMDGDDKYE